MSSASNPKKINPNLKQYLYTQCKIEISVESALSVLSQVIRVAIEVLQALQLD